MEQAADSDKYSTNTMCATEVFNSILSQIQISNLNFQLQLSPFSAQISLRKSFVKDRTGAFLLPPLQPSNIPDLVNKNLELKNDLTNLRNKYEKLVNDCDHAYIEAVSVKEELTIENENLREIIKEKEDQCEYLKGESNLLQSKIENAEEKMIEHVSETKDKITKLSSEISTLKSDASKAHKLFKSKEKDIYNLVKKNENLSNKIDNLQASKDEVKKERDKLVKEIKKLEKNCASSKLIKANSAQIESESNNNLSPDHPCVQTLSSSTQTAPFHAASSLEKCPVTGREFKCFVCSDNFNTVVFNEAPEFEKHMKAEHELSINLDKLYDEEGEEDDDFVRFVKSIEMESDYIQERIKYYPEHWDHIEERVKFRFLAMKKLEICSKHIENNMKWMDVKNISYSGSSREY